MAGLVKFDMSETQMQRSAQLGAEIAFGAQTVQTEMKVPAAFATAPCFFFFFFLMCLADRCKLLLKRY